MQQHENLMRKISRWYTTYKVKNNNSGIQGVLEILTMIFIWIIFGVRISEQNLYNFNQLTKKQKRNIFRIRDNVRFINKVNGKKSIHVLRNKNILLERLQDDLKRDFIYLKVSDDNSIIQFIQKHARFVLKPNSQAGGRGVGVGWFDGQHVTINYSNSIKQYTVEEFLSAWINEDVLLEEYVKQHEALSKVYPLAVNTLRMHTITINNDVDIVLQHTIRFGSKMGIIDFDHGLSLFVNDDGQLDKHAIEVLKGTGQIKIHTSHPDTGFIFKDYQLPFWSEIKQLVIDTAKKFPELSFVGWDIAISEEGPVIIEGNGAPGTYSGIQLNQLTFSTLTYKENKKQLLDVTLYRKKLHPKKINRINKKLFVHSSISKWNQCTQVIVLGSKECHYRIERAYQLFKNTDAYYVVCGGNPSVYTNKNNEHLSEAEYMRTYLLQQGVLSSRILIENTSTNTKENIDHALSIIHRLALPGPIGVISGAFHLKRIQIIVNQLDQSKTLNKRMVYIPAYGKKTKPTNWFRSNFGTFIIQKEINSTLFKYK